MGNPGQWIIKSDLATIGWGDEGLRVVNPFYWKNENEKFIELVPTNPVPAVAVIQVVRVLFVFNGRKGHVGVR